MCGGCEAKTAQELYTGAQGTTARRAIAVTDETVELRTPIVIHMTEPGGGIMDADVGWLPTVRIAQTAGTCLADCSPGASCTSVLTFTLTFLAIMPDPNGSGPDPNFGPILTFTPPAGGTVEGGSTIDIEPESEVLGVSIRDDAEGIVGSVSYLVKYTVDVTFAPGCGTTATYLIGFANYAIDAATGWTRTNPAQNSPAFEIGCHDCQSGKRGTVTQASGRNADAASIDLRQE